MGDTSLHLAVSVGSLEVAKILISNGANVHLRNERGDSPLQWFMLPRFGKVAHACRTNRISRAMYLSNSVNSNNLIAFGDRSIGLAQMAEEHGDSPLASSIRRCHSSQIGTFEHLMTNSQTSLFAKSSQVIDPPEFQFATGVEMDIDSSTRVGESETADALSCLRSTSEEDISFACVGDTTDIGI